MATAKKTAAKKAAAKDKTETPEAAPEEQAPEAPTAEQAEAQAAAERQVEEEANASAQADAGDQEPAEDSTLEELRKEASELDVEGRSSMNKEELAAAVEAKRGEQGDAQAGYGEDEAHLRIDSHTGLPAGDEHGPIYKDGVEVEPATDVGETAAEQATPDPAEGDRPQAEE